MNRLPMRRRPLHVTALAVALSLWAASCKQPFEPDGPAGTKLILYCILNGQTDTQYVRVASTYRNGSNPEVHGATVSVRAVGGSGPAVTFRDTMIDRVNTLGVLEHLPVYVADHFRPAEGVSYALTAEAGAGTQRLAGATTVSLFAPTIRIGDVSTLDFNTDKPLVLNIGFLSITGAAEAHLYIEYYHLVNNGWVLGREEVAKGSYTDAAGKEVLIFPSLIPVTALTASRYTPGTIAFDGGQYKRALGRVTGRYGAEFVVLLQATFFLTQVDDVLYSYYYLNNGVIDQSSIRLDVPEFTNIRGGLGVFGSSVVVRKAYSIRE